MKKIKILTAAIFCSLFISLPVMAQTPVPMGTQPGLTYTENFEDIANWTNNFAGGAGANRFGSVAVNANGTIPDGIRTTSSSATFVTGATGGVQRGTAQTPATQSIVLLSTGATDNTTSVAFDLLMDFSGVNAGTLSFDWTSVNNSTGNRNGSLRVYWSTNGTTFTEISPAQVLNFTNNVLTVGSITAATLPAEFNNNPTARLRFYYHNGTGGTTGSRPKISIDNLVVTAVSTANPAVNLSVSSNAGSEAETTAIIVTATASNAVMGDQTVDLIVSGTGITSGDYTLFPATITIPNGQTAGAATFTVVDDLIFEGTETAVITEVNPSSGIVLGTMTTQNVTITDNDSQPTFQFDMAYYSAVEGTSPATITVTRSGALGGTDSVVYSTVAGGTATGGGSCGGNVDYVSTDNTLTFNPTEMFKTFTVTLCADSFVENPAETVYLTLTGPTGGTLGIPDTAVLSILDAATQFINTETIFIPDNGQAGSAAITVSGFSQNMAGLRLTLFGLSHPKPDDLDILLVGPGGHKFIVMADTGGINPLNNATLTFEDSALVFLPDSGTITNGQNYKPTDCEPPQSSFQAPAPGVPYSTPGCVLQPFKENNGTQFSTFAGVFGGTNPNGIWTLYVRDDSAGGFAEFGSSQFAAGGWGIQFLTPTAANVSVSGRVTTVNSTAIPNVGVMLSGGGLTEPTFAKTNTFGNYRFENVPAGESYVVTVFSPRYNFPQPSFILNVVDNVTDVNFEGGEP